MVLAVMGWGAWPPGPLAPQPCLIIYHLNLIKKDSPIFRNLEMETLLGHTGLKTADAVNLHN